MLMSINTVSQISHCQRLLFIFTVFHHPHLQLFLSTARLSPSPLTNKTITWEFPNSPPPPKPNLQTGTCIHPHLQLQQRKSPSSYHHGIPFAIIRTPSPLPFQRLCSMGYLFSFLYFQPLVPYISFPLTPDPPS